MSARRDRSMPVWLVINATRLPRRAAGTSARKVSIPGRTAGVWALTASAKMDAVTKGLNTGAVYSRPCTSQAEGSWPLGIKKRVVVNDTMQKGYAYWRTEPIGRNFAPGFAP